MNFEYLHFKMQFKKFKSRSIIVFFKNYLFLLNLTANFILQIRFFRNCTRQYLYRQKCRCFMDFINLLQENLIHCY